LSVPSYTFDVTVGELNVRGLGVMDPEAVPEARM
jgi:hypothetical protein